MKTTNKKGFTLMEMLIVVAIIAILIAIAIPILTNVLEKARETADAANIRAAYAEVMIMAMTGDHEAVRDNSEVYVIDVPNDEHTYYKATVVLLQQKTGWQTKSLHGIADISIGQYTGAKSLSYEEYLYKLESGTLSDTDHYNCIDDVGSGKVVAIYYDTANGNLYFAVE